MKTIKQLLTTIAVLLCSVMAHAYDFEVDGIFYNITSAGNLAIEVTYKDSKYNSYSGNVVIPETVVYNGKTYRVTSIGQNAFNKCTELTNVILPNSIVTIGKYAFSNCSKLTNITIPNNVTTIDQQAFYGCESITSITIPSSVTYINEKVFHNCTSLKDLRIEDGETILMFDMYNMSTTPFYHSPLENVYLGRNVGGGGSGTHYSCWLFYNKQLLTSLTIGNNVTTIESYTFYQCTGLTNVIIPNSITSIESNAFTGCTNLKDIYYTSTTPPTSLWLVENTYVPNKEAYSKTKVSGGSGNFIEYVTFNNTTFTYGETPNATFINNLENKGYTANISLPELPRNAGTHTIEIPFTFSKGNSKIEVNIPYTYTINKATLVAKADTVARLYGENNPEFTISYNGFVNNEDESILTNKGTVITSATAKSNVGEYPTTVSGVTANNYEIQYETGTLIINKAPLSVIADNATKIYGDNNPQFTLSYSGLKNNETYPEMITNFNISTEALKTSNVGEYNITVSGGEAKNYEITNYTNGKLSITKAPLTITADNTTKVYGDANPSFDFSCMGLKNNDAKDEIFTTNPTISCSATNSSNAGSYDITISGGETYNYEITYYKKGTLTITKAPLTIISNNYTRLYGDANPIFEYTCTGLKNSDKLDNIFDTKPQAICNATEKSSVGEYEINFIGGEAQNYNIINSVKGILTVNKAPITIIANNLTKVYGDNNPQFTLSYSGLKNDETAPEMITVFNISTEASNISNVGEYDIIVANGEAKNYEITNYTNGKLSILKAPLTITANNATKVYGDANPAFDFSCSGLKNDDTKDAIFSTKPTLTCSTTNESNTGNYDITISDGETYNYEITDYVNGTLTITKAPLTITSNNYTRLYGDVNPVFEYTCTGLKNSDKLDNIFDTKPQAICNATEKSSVGEYEINFIGGESNNYNIINSVKGILTVNKAPITIIANNLTKIYGDENPKYTLTYNGLKNDEIAPEMTSAFNISTEATKTSNVGEYEIIVSGGETRNYEIANYINGKLSILKAPLTITATNITKIYGDRNPEFKYSYNGAKNNDDENAIFETRPTMSCDADEKSYVGEYNIVINGAESNNYEISYITGVLSINKREITVSTKNYTRIYREENPEFEISYNGFVNNEDESALLIKPKAKTIAEKDSDVGTYEIYIDGGDAENYSFAYNSGTLTIEKANQTITWEQEFNNIEVGTQVELTATASSGLDIEYVIPDNNFISVYTIDNTTYLDCYGTGEIAIRATQNGNKNYNAAVRISKVIKIGNTDTGISNIFTNLNVNINNNSISLLGINNNTITIYTINGVLVKSIDNYSGEEIPLDKGLYIVCIGNESIKIKI